MALNINTNLTNNLDGYLLDAKNVKGTYVVVSNYSDLANLPSACVVNGTLAYCQNDTYIQSLDTEYSKGFYKYNGTSWDYFPLSNTKTILTKYSSSSIDLTQTYTWSLSDVTSIINDLVATVGSNGVVEIQFSNIALLFTFTGTATAQNKGDVSMVMIYDNKQYITTLSMDATAQNFFTLSFQELQASGGGGGGSTTTKKWWAIEYKEYDEAYWNNGNPTATNVYKAWIDDDEMTDILTYINSQMSTSLQTPQDLITFYNSVKMDDYTLTSQTETLFSALSRLFTTFTQLSMAHSKIPSWYVDGDGAYIYPDIISPIGIETNNAKWISTTGVWESLYMCFSTHSTLTITEETEVIGGSSSGDGSGDGSIYTFRIKINTPPVYVEQGSFSTIDEYVGYYIFDNDEYVLVTNDNKNSLGIVPNTTLYYEQNTLPNTPYSYLYFDINEVYFNDSNVIKDLNAMLESAGISTLDSLDDLPTYWNSVDISAKSFLVNIISSMGNNFKREFGSNDVDEDGFYSIANYTYLSASSSNESIRWDGYTIGNSTYTDLSSFANDGVMEYVGKTGGSGSGSGGEVVGGSGKLYELNFELTRYDANGDSVDWSFGGAGITPETFNYPLPLCICFYESNFEKIKSKMSGVITGINTPQDLVNFINTHFSETTASTTNDSFVILEHLIGLADKTYLSVQALPQYPAMQVEVFGNTMMDAALAFGGDLTIRWNGNNFVYANFQYNDGNDDLSYGLSVNNTCTLTEYGTSGGGGGSTPSDSVGDNYIIKFTCEKTLTNPDDSSDVQTFTDKYQLLISEKIFENFAEGQQDVPASTLPELVEYINNNAMYKQGFLAYFLIGMASTCSGHIWKYEYDAGYHLNQLIVQNVDFTKMSAENYTSMSDWTIENIPDKVGGSGGGGTTQTKNVYEMVIKTSNDGNALSTNNYNSLVCKISEEQFNNALPEINEFGVAVLGSSWATITDIAQMKQVADYTFANLNSLTWGALQGCICIFVKYALLENRIPYANLRYLKSGNTYADYMSFAVSIGQVSSGFPQICGGKINAFETTFWFGMDSLDEGEKILFSSNSSFTYTTEQEVVSGGSSSGGGSQPSSEGIYTFKLEWDSSDDNTKRESISFTVNEIEYKNYPVYNMGMQISGQTSPMYIPLSDWVSTLTQLINAGGQDAGDALGLLMMVIHYLSYNCVITFTYQETENDYELTTYPIYAVDLSLPNATFYWCNGNHVFNIATILQSNPTFTLLGRK